MKSRQLSMLAGAAVVLVVLAVLTTTTDDQRGDVPRESELLVPGLQERINDVTRILVTLDAENLLTLRKGEAGWTVDERDSFAANGAQLRKLLLNLADTRLREQKTSNPDNYPRLGVQDLAEAGEDTRGVRLEADDKVLADIIVGKTGNSGNSYVRRVGESESWLSSQWLDVPGRAGGWLDARLLSVEPERVISVEIAGEGPSLVLRKSEEGDWSLYIDGNQTNAKVDELARIARVLQDLTIDDLGEVAADTPGDWHTTRFTTSDGLVVVVESRSVDDQLYARFRASATRHAESAVADEAAAIETKVKDRTFLLASYMKDRFAPDSASLIEVAETQ